MPHFQEKAVTEMDWRQEARPSVPDSCSSMQQEETELSTVAPRELSNCLAEAWGTPRAASCFLPAPGPDGRLSLPSIAHASADCPPLLRKMSA